MEQEGSWHAHIHQNDIGAQRKCLLQGFLAVRSSAYDGNAFLHSK